MGSFNPNQGPEINPELNQQQIIRQELNPGEKLLISYLFNSVYYFIQDVFILKIKDQYRLVALHNNRVLIDRYYHTDRGCRIAFQKYFKDKAWSDEVKANWSDFYDPDKEWLKEKCKNLK